MKLIPPWLSTYVQLLKDALDEDIGPEDVTSVALVYKSRRASAIILARQEGILAGLFLLQPLVNLLDRPLQIEPFTSDGQALQYGQQVVRISGPCRELLALERTALNFLAHLSGIATLTNRFVRAVQGTSAVICDTRKTTPGLRILEKYAVRAGGGCNHRLGLYDSALIKDNHLLCLEHSESQPDVFSALAHHLAELRRRLPARGFIELEVDNLGQFRRALELKLDLDMILLDNFSLADLAEAVKIRNQVGLGGKLLLEASGNITLDTVGQIARTGVERISVGALTHSAPAFDFSMEFAAK